MNIILKKDFDHIFERYKLDLEAIKNQHVLITGVNGMIANYLANFLSYLNSQHNFGITLTGLAKKLPQNRVPDVNYLVGNVCDFNFQEHTFDHIIHSASLASPIYYGSNPIETSLPNVEGTINLLRRSESLMLKSFVFLSSSEVYGTFRGNKSGIDEAEYGTVDPMNQRSCYAESKRMGENLCVSWFHQKKIPVKIIRPFHTYGPGLRKDDGRVFADFIYSILDKKDIVLNSRGEAKRAFCYLSDAVGGILLVMLKGKSGEAYNLGNPYEEWSIFEAAVKATQAYPDRNLKVTINENYIGSGYLKSKVLRNCPAIKKIQSLGWTPNVSLLEGFRRTVQFIEFEEMTK